MVRCMEHTHTPLPGHRFLTIDVADVLSISCGARNRGTCAEIRVLVSILNCERLGAIRVHEEQGRRRERERTRVEIVRD